ncbi:mRNA-decapping enzyme subunit 2 [Nematocida major]|uniref:mRNA-decapping enzyme subunit 2 n=1 Tax=Nematocida major TaxID=1912982 RepID=UPI0020088A5C|nr:mRNA-decapping enzyme subunit 2 [Nematocida major]KAH9386151.1 mRNA-decapping enzyme subunit 2 [Nematocida major]
MKLNDIMDDLSGRFLMHLTAEEYKNTERLFFQVEEAHWFYQDYYRRKHNLPYLNLRDFTLHLISHSNFANNVTEIDENFKKFLKYKKIVPVFGALIFNCQMTKILLVQGFGAKKSFTFPRGKVCKSENAIDCAVREVYEEVGYNIRGKLIYDLCLETGSKTRESRLFAILNVSEQTTAFETKTRCEIKDIKWIEIDHIEKTACEAYSYVKTYIKDIKKLVSEIEKTKPRLDINKVKKAFAVQ